jgi:flagellar protein FliO/FliZ
MNRAVRTHALLGLIVFPALTMAQTVDPIGGSSIAVILQVLFGLALVLGAFALVAVLMRRFMPVQRGASGVLRLVGGIMVGPRERVVVVEVGETWLVLGVANGQVRALHTLPREEMAKEVPVAGQPAFADWLARVRGKHSVNKGQ